MTLAAAGAVPIPYPAVATGFTNAGTLDAASEKAALIFQCPKAGNIDRVCLRTASITTGATLTVRLETLGTDGNPSGTLVGTTTDGSLVLTGTDDNLWFEVTLTAAATVTRGQYVAVVVGWVTPFNGIIAATLNTTNNLQAAFPYTSLFTGTWAKSTGYSLVVAVRYDDTTYPYIEGCLPALTSTTVVMGNASSPDEVGNRFELPFPCRVSGAWVGNAAAVNGDFQVILYDASSSVLASVTVDGDHDSGTTNIAMYRLRLSADVQLTAATVYRLALKPTTSTAVNLYGFGCPNTTLFNSLPHGTAVQRTHRTDAGAWTDTNTDRMFMGLIVDQLDDGAGGGGSVNVLVPMHSE